MGERMSGADAAWLHMDRPTNRMIVNFLLRFAGRPDWDAVGAAVQERLVEPYPRLRECVNEPIVSMPPVSVPQWVPASEFRLDNHLRRVRLAAGDDRALLAYVESQVSEALDPALPLWQLHCIDCDQHSSALLLRTHHALGDGTALIHALLALSDPDDGPPQGPAAVTAPPSDAPAGPAGYRSALTSASGVATALPRAIFGDSDSRETITASFHSLRKLATVRQDRQLILRERLGLEKSLARCNPVSLDDLKRVARTDAVTVNDVLLSVVTAAFGEYLRERGGEATEIVAMLPVNIRPMDTPLPRRWGNRFGLVYPALPVAVMSRGDRVVAVHTAMQEVKQAQQAHVVFSWLSSIGYAPRRVENTLIDSYAGMGSVIISNVTGPRRQLSIAGTPVASLLFWVPTSGPVGIGVSMISYAGNVTLGLMVDQALVPDVDRLCELMNEELAALSSTP
jgi:diacylglycerol O-acyltransferase / wax synthase